MEVHLLDLKKQYEKIQDEIALAAKEVFDSQYFILGPKVAELEKQVSEYCQCKFAVGVSSGTDALLISLMTAGIGSGDLVVTTPYTFFATAGVITRVGANPVFIDIDKDTYNMDPQKFDETISSLGGVRKSKIKAVMPVHLYGQCADMESILNVAETYGLTVIEDAAQAIGAEYEFRDGTVRRAGAMGHFGCFSFFPSKNLGAFGDGGMVTTDEEELYEKMKVMRVHGSEPKYYHSVVGGNFRLDALQAAILMVKLKYLDDWTKDRQENANHYRKFFQEKGIDEISLPKVVERRHIYNQYVIKVREDRDSLKEFLHQQGIGCEVYYPLPLHMQACFSYLGYKHEEFPISVTAADTTLALPIYPELTTDQISYVVEMIGKFFRR